MTQYLDRRALLLTGAAIVLTGCAPENTHPAPSKSPSSPSHPPDGSTPVESPPVELDLTDLPSGVYGVWGTLDGRTVVHEPTVRIRMCSTMKLPLVALVLRERARGTVDLDTSLSWDPSDLIGHSPFTRGETDSTATVVELAEAAARLSDNTAANLLIDEVGGLRELGDFARSFGDRVTRFDRYETAMNSRDGDLDTTSAEAFCRFVTAAVESLSESDRRTLFSWVPGRDDRRIAAAAPADIEFAHKTGTSGDGVLNDVAVLRAGDGVAGSLAILTESQDPSEDVVVEIARRAFAVLTE